MTDIQFKKKPRKDGTGYWTVDGKRWSQGRDWALQNEIEEARQRTRDRGCFKECRTCGSCANSSRDATYPFEYDWKAKKMISCTGCEPFRFHDCHNGVMRNSRGEAEPFTPDQIALLEKTGGKPLI